ncbi:hypothetical protein M501DRAFT_1017498 [Patellaria atrata CBS 101060]|uniref:Uncharacterized protein n=1 Tax=Patellaria atrata CBS 101060 TaxID=1346257 RepID=A0A9P4S7Z2_9PEZI|nr:hypothetical protein M501DRAFT_1017498 [Patellaria atrata CBS 101060]
MSLPPPFSLPINGKESRQQFTLHNVRLTNLYKGTMNRMFTKKKAKVVSEDDSSGFSIPSKKNKKGKKGEPEMKPQVDLSTALPSSDDFRTSLLMPNLSARFSMLREQDDPNSKIGKASDDSVLQPKRQSRLADFGFKAGALADIDEVSSINSSIRPPFAYGRQGSVDSYATDDENAQNGSVMSRSRPGEGNVLFGGRQKIYTLNDRGMGRALYEDDVALSSFQRLRQEERERERQRVEAELNAELEEQDISPKESANSPSISGLSKRETSSSTNSGPSFTRTSTAATSIASQGAGAIPPSPPTVPSAPSQFNAAPNLDRSKTRRLYESGLDRDIHDQQSSAMNRLNSIQKQRIMNTIPTPPSLSQVRSSPNLQDRFNRAGHPIRAASPPPSAPLMNVANFEIRRDTERIGQTSILPHSPPMSPLGSDSEEHNPLPSAIRPSDRGKATAMGAFNKPKQFDEQQYLQRTLQMQRGRETPPIRKESPSPSRPVQTMRAEFERRRAESNNTSRSNSVSQPEPPSALSVFQKAASQLRANVSESPEAKSASNVQQTSVADTPNPEIKLDSQRTFFASPDDSEVEDESYIKTETKPVVPKQERRRVVDPRNIPTTDLPAPPIYEHPALRSTTSLEHSPREERANKDLPELPQSSLSDRALSVGTLIKSDATDVDSPTLGPNTGGLSGLVRQHLRNTSTQSSVYGDVPAPLALRTQDVGLRPTQGSESETPAHSSYSYSNPWDLEDYDRSYYGEVDSRSSVSPVDNSHVKVQTNETTKPTPRAHPSSGTDYNMTSPWEEELQKKHSRGASTETTHEREALANELAERRRQIQESVRNKVANQSRSASPSPGPFKALGILRNKVSRDSMAVNQDVPVASTKAMKMLGINASTMNTSTTSLSGQGSPDDRSNNTNEGREVPEGPSRHPMSHSIQSRVPQDDSAIPSEVGTPKKRGPSEEEPRDIRPKGKSPPSSTKSSIRNRSSSDMSSGRSRSRAVPYRDDVEKCMAGGTNSVMTIPSPQPVAPLSPIVPQSFVHSARPIGEVEAKLHHKLTPEEHTARARTNSKSGYFDQRTLLPIQTSHSNTSLPRLSPGMLSPNPGVSPIPSPRPSPGPFSPSLRSGIGAGPYSANSTPPISASTTPVAPAFDRTGTMPQMSRIPTHRKKSVNKHDISEPTLISKTSTVDLVSLPPGASLANGANGPPPPLPPLNPRRRRFGFGRSENGQDNTQTVSPIQTSIPQAVPETSAFSDEDDKPRQRQRLRKSSSEGRSLHAKAMQPPVGLPRSPAMQPPVGLPRSPAISHGFAGPNGSPPKPAPEAIQNIAESACAGVGGSSSVRVSASASASASGAYETGSAVVTGTHASATETKTETDAVATTTGDVDVVPETYEGGARVMRVGTGLGMGVGAALAVLGM